METQVVKIEKSHKESSKGTLRRVCLDEDDQDDRNELALSLARQSDPERKQLSTNGVKVNQLHGHRRTASATDDIGSWIVVSDDGVLHKALASHLSDLHENGVKKNTAEERDLEVCRIHGLIPHVVK
ncbi:hypothetical protein Bca101_066523 [Brassica carinata]